MSKTYKTDPAWVYLLNPEQHKEFKVEEWHDHEKGPCDLPEKPTRANWSYPYRTECTWRLVYFAVSTCGCRMCTQYYERKWERKKNRLQGKAYSKRDYIKEYE